MTVKTCPKCHKKFTLGVDGVEDQDGVIKCDACAGVVRDANGYAWFPNEVSAMYTRDGGKTVTVRQRPS